MSVALKGISAPVQILESQRILATKQILTLEHRSRHLSGVGEGAALPGRLRQSEKVESR
jgi:hypothetical protein